MFFPPLLFIFIVLFFLILIFLFGLVHVGIMGYASSKSPYLAYIAGTMGTLIGADILNLGKIKRLNAPVASIGGAGTFDGIFFTGIMAVLLA